MKKKIIDTARLRRVPPRFSWVDHRLIRHRLLRGCRSQSWALYLFLVTVADADGISYYSDGALCMHLGLETAALEMARHELTGAGLVAWEEPFYQVLEVSAVVPAKAWTGGVL
jgi:hypothetical protein